MFLPVACPGIPGQAFFVYSDQFLTVVLGSGVSVETPNCWMIVPEVDFKTNHRSLDGLKIPASVFPSAS